MISFVVKNNTTGVISRMMMRSSLMLVLLLLLLLLLSACCYAFVALPPSAKNAKRHSRSSCSPPLMEMKRPILDQIATTLFKLENDRVEASSEVDDKGRMGEPMEWSEENSAANQFSEIVASNPIGYRFKQWVADIVAGDYDQEATRSKVDDFISSNEIAMFSFTTCPFCRRAKDALEERGVAFQSLELDELEGNTGNEIRAELGRKTKRTSVPSIFVLGKYIGGCNDGPGLLPLMESGEFDRLLKS